jgi:Na+-transporting NADH:ubiquinone oxidoreductase subunit C
VNARFRAVLFTAAVTAAFVAPVSLLHLLTEARVELNREVRLKRAVLEAAGLEVPASGPETAALFDSRVEPSGAEDGDAYSIKSPDGTGGNAYVRTQAGAGLWGRIVALVGFEADGVTMTGLSFLEQTETPGLGARIDEAWFKAQFRGKRGPLATVPEGAAAGADQFDAVSGATITSNAVRDILNAAAAEMRARARK